MSMKLQYKGHDRKVVYLNNFRVLLLPGSVLYVDDDTVHSNEDVRRLMESGLLVCIDGEKSLYAR